MIKNVLAVDNDPFMLEFIKDTLPCDRYEVFTAKDGLHALDILDMITPDIIFVDLVMPNIDGKRLCKIIRSNERLQNTYLIILSATATEERINVENLGVNACIAKGPLKQMAQLIHEVLAHPDAAALRCRAGEIIGADKSSPRTITNELLDAGKHFEAIMEVMSEGILEITSTGRIIRVNPAAVSLIDIPESRLLGSDFFDLFSETDRPEVLAICKTRKDSETTNRKCLVQINDRQVILKTLTIKTGEGFTLFNILDDVTEARRMQTQRAQAKKREALGSLSAGVAHNFNNLIMAIQGNISLLLLKEEVNQEVRDRLKTIEEFLKSGSKLTAQLIGFTKDGDYTFKPTDLNKIIEKCSGMFHQTNSEVLIHQKYQKDIWIVDADLGQLEQVFFNLYVNAKQAMPGGGELYLETQNITLDENSVGSLGMNGRDFVKVSVRDTGIGMDKKTQEKIFEPFFTTRKADMGTGLGLSSVYKTIRDHGGTVIVQSEKGKGTLFNIFLPVPANRIPGEKHSFGAMDMGKESILFVENEEQIRDVGKQMLEKMGYSCLTAQNGRSALEIYEERKHQIDMVILDVGIPGMGGEETFDRLARMNPKIKVLFSSGNGMNGQISDILQRGSSAFIHKPFDINELSQKVRDVLKYKVLP